MIDMVMEKCFQKKIVISRKSIIITEFQKQLEIILTQNIDILEWQRLMEKIILSKFCQNIMLLGKIDCKFATNEAIWFIFAWIKRYIFYLSKDAKIIKIKQFNAKLQSNWINICLSKNFIVSHELWWVCMLVLIFHLIFTIIHITIASN